MKILICRILKAVHCRVYKCIAILHTPMGRTHGENSMSKLDNDATRVANIYMELPYAGMGYAGMDMWIKYMMCLTEHTTYTTSSFGSQ